MVQLILTVLAIALAAAATLATVNYAPWWTKAVDEYSALTRSSIQRLETAYIAQARTTTSTALDPIAAPDGGLTAIYGSMLGFTPASPPGYVWTYGKRPASGAYANTHYFCLTPAPTTTLRNEAVAKAFARIAQTYSAEQFIQASSCGATANEALGPDALPVVTFYVKALPDVGL